MFSHAHPTALRGLAMVRVHQQAPLFRNMAKVAFSMDDVPDLQGKTALVTGATSGIGLQLAKALARARARVLLLARESDDPEAAQCLIRASATDKGAVPDVTFIPCDLGDLQNVKDVADALRAEHDRLDLLVCDAGIGVNKFDLSADGLDRHFAVNHLGHFLLVNRLLPLLARAAAAASAPPTTRKAAPVPAAFAAPFPPRVVVVSSSLHAVASPAIQFVSPMELHATHPTASSPLGLYARAKLANLLFVRHGLVPRLGPALLALATHPGAVHTGQQDQFAEAYGPTAGAALKATTVPFMRTPEQGCLSTLWAATAHEVAENREMWQGAYVTDPGEDGSVSSMALDKQLGERLWGLSEQLIRAKLGEDALLPWQLH